MNIERAKILKDTETTTSDQTTSELSELPCSLVDQVADAISKIPLDQREDATAWAAEYLRQLLHVNHSKSLLHIAEEARDACGRIYSQDKVVGQCRADDLFSILTFYIKANVSREEPK